MGMSQASLELETVLFVLELVGIAAFAIAGALRAIEREMDVFGIIVLAAITALGGGFIRDMLADRFPISLERPAYFYTALGAGMLTILSAGVVSKYSRWLSIFDALGLAVFSVLGAQVGLARELNILSVLLFGLLTGIGGGVLRDVLANDVPLVFRQEVYALASLLGIAVQWALHQAGVASSLSLVAGALVILAIRLAAIHWHLNLPRIRHHDAQK